MKTRIKDSRCCGQDSNLSFPKHRPARCFSLWLTLNNICSRQRNAAIQRLVLLLCAYKDHGYIIRLDGSLHDFPQFLCPIAGIATSTSFTVHNLQSSPFYAL
jgi:hypothetical protein